MWYFKPLAFLPFPLGTPPAKCSAPGCLGGITRVGGGPPWLSPLKWKNSASFDRPPALFPCSPPTCHSSSHPGPSFISLTSFPALSTTFSHHASSSPNLLQDPPHLFLLPWVLQAPVSPLPFTPTHAGEWGDGVVVTFKPAPPYKLLEGQRPVFLWRTTSSPPWTDAGLAGCCHGNLQGYLVQGHLLLSSLLGHRYSWSLHTSPAYRGSGRNLQVGGVCGLLA